MSLTAKYIILHKLILTINYFAIKESICFEKNKTTSTFLHKNEKKQKYKKLNIFMIFIFLVYPKGFY